MLNSSTYNFSVGSITSAGTALSPDESLYLKALEVRNFEISQLVQRNNFFMIFQGVLLAGVLQSEGKVAAVSSAICLAGMLIAVAQYRVAAGAKYWQQKWESELLAIEARLRNSLSVADFRSLFIPTECINPARADCVCDACTVERDLTKKTITDRLVNKLIRSKPSVSRIPIYVGVVLTLTWSFCSMWFFRLALLV